MLTHNPNQKVWWNVQMFKMLPRKKLSYSKHLNPNSLLTIKMPGALTYYWEAQLFESIFKKAEGIWNSILLRSNNITRDTRTYVQKI